MLKHKKLIKQDAKHLLKIRHNCILKLCTNEHNGNQDEILQWANNKTVKQFEHMLIDSNLLFVAFTINNRIIGFGHGNLQGRILSNYIDPNKRFMGISKSIIAALEQYYIKIGIHNITLESSQTAYGFYQKLGWKRQNINNTTLEMYKNI